MLPIIDLHCDTLLKLSAIPASFYHSSPEAATHITYPGLCDAGVVLQCFALFTDLCDTPENSPLSCIMEQFSCFQRILTLSGGRLSQIKTRTDLSELRQNKLGTLLTLEESCLSVRPVSLLSKFYELGVRIATLTWDYSNLLATAAVNARPSRRSALFGTPRPSSGLTPYGYEFIEEAEHLGITIDVSHLSDSGFFSVAAHSRRPFLASHSNARAVCSNPRNLTDDMLKLLANRGGIVGLCLHEPFLSASAKTPEDIADALVHHIRHIRSIAGAEALALGTDFDGTPGNRLIPDVSYLPRLEPLCKKAGLTSRETELLFSGNALRFLTEVLPS